MRKLLEDIADYYYSVGGIAGRPGKDRPCPKCGKRFTLKQWITRNADGTHKTCPN